MTPAISVAGLTRRYWGQRVLEDMSFTVPGGTITGLLGRNGAGNPVTELWLSSPEVRLPDRAGQGRPCPAA